MPVCEALRLFNAAISILVYLHLKFNPWAEISRNVTVWFDVSVLISSRSPLRYWVLNDSTGRTQNFSVKLNEAKLLKLENHLRSNSYKRRTNRCLWLKFVHSHMYIEQILAADASDEMFGNPDSHLTGNSSESELWLPEILATSQSLCSLTRQE